MMIDIDWALMGLLQLHLYAESVAIFETLPQN